jgi:hypothetical protein
MEEQEKPLHSVSMYEHLGWMTLAKERGHHDKIQCYMNGIDRLLMQLKEKWGKSRNETEKMT